MSQEDAAARLEPYLGQRWSKSTFSIAESSWKSDRVRQFTADDLLAFGRPINEFLVPPEAESVRIVAGDRSVTRDDYLAAFDLDAAKLKLVELARDLGERERSYRYMAESQLQQMEAQLEKLPAGAK